jgi:hypothetical protein
MDDYIASVEEAGARVRVLEVSDSARKLVGEIDGLLSRAASFQLRRRRARTR